MGSYRAPPDPEPYRAHLAEYFRGYESVPGVPEVLSRSASGGDFRVWCPDALEVGELPEGTRTGAYIAHGETELNDVELLTSWLQAEMQRSPLAMVIINYYTRPDSRFLPGAAMKWIPHDDHVLFLGDASTCQTVPLDAAVWSWLPSRTAGTLVFRGHDRAPGFDDLATSEVVAAFTEVHDEESLLWWSDRRLAPP